MFLATYSDDGLLVGRLVAVVALPDLLLALGALVVSIQVKPVGKPFGFHHTLIFFLIEPFNRSNMASSHQPTSQAKMSCCWSIFYGKLGKTRSGRLKVLGEPTIRDTFGRESVVKKKKMNNLAERGRYLRQGKRLRWAWHCSTQSLVTILPRPLTSRNLGVLAKAETRCVHWPFHSGLYLAPMASSRSRSWPRNGFWKPLSTATTPSSSRPNGSVFVLLTFFTTRSASSLKKKDNNESTNLEG